MNIQETNYKTEELAKYRALVFAAIDYDITRYQDSPLQGFDPVSSLESLKKQAEEHFVRGRLATLKSWYRNLTDGIREGREFIFNTFVQEHTGYTIDIFKEHFDSVEKLIAKGRITTDNQFFDVHSMVEYLTQTEPVDQQKIDVLNNLLVTYEQQKHRK